MHIPSWIRNHFRIHDMESIIIDFTNPYDNLKQHFTHVLWNVSTALIVGVLVVAMHLNWTGKTAVNNKISTIKLTIEAELWKCLRLLGRYAHFHPLAHVKWIAMLLLFESELNI